MGKYRAKGLFVARICYQPKDRAAGTAGHQNRGADRFLCPRRTATGGGCLLRRTGVRRLLLRGGLDPLGTETGCSHRQLRGRFCAENAHQTGGWGQRLDYHAENIGGTVPGSRTP